MLLRVGEFEEVVQVAGHDAQELGHEPEPRAEARGVWKTAYEHCVSVCVWVCVWVCGCVGVWVWVWVWCVWVCVGVGVYILYKYSKFTCTLLHTVATELWQQHTLRRARS